MPEMHTRHLLWRGRQDRAPSPQLGAQVAEGLERGTEDRLGVVDPALSAQPFDTSAAGLDRVPRETAGSTDKQRSLAKRCSASGSTRTRT
jgi:hypothetical protein